MPSLPALNAALEDALSRLPEKLRLPLVFKYAEGFTESEIVQACGCPPPPSREGRSG